MFIRKTKLLLILTIFLMSVFSVSQAKNYPINLDKVDTELHPWGGDDNFNPDDVQSSPDLAPPIIIGTKTHRGLVVSLWKFMVFKVEMMYLDFTRTTPSSTTLHGTTGTTGANGATSATGSTGLNNTEGGN